MFNIFLYKSAITEHKVLIVVFCVQSAIKRFPWLLWEAPLEILCFYVFVKCLANKLTKTLLEYCRRRRTSLISVDKHLFSKY